MSFAQNFVSKINNKISDEDLKLIYMELEAFCCNFDIRKKETDLVVSNIFPSFYKTFFIAKKIKGCSQGTLNQYKLQLDRFFTTINKPVEQITTEDIIMFLYLLQNKPSNFNGKVMSAGVADGVRRVLNSFFDWSVNNGYLRTNPVARIEKIKSEQKKRKPLTEIELEKVRYAIDNAHRNSKGYRKRDLDIRNLAIFELMYSTGARISEVTSLNISDIDFDTKEVNLIGKGNKHRKSYINAKAILYITQYLKTRDDDNEALFVNYKAPHTRMTNSGIRYMFRRYGYVAEVGKLFPHRIRHTTATLALNHGMRLEELQKLLGHSKPETTLIYAELAQENVRNAHQRYII